MTPDDILQDMANELICDKYEAIREKTRNFSLLKELSIWIHKFHPKYNSLKDLVTDSSDTRPTL